MVDDTSSSKREGSVLKINSKDIYKYFDLATLFFLSALIFFLPISKAAIQITVSLTILSFLGASITSKFRNFPKTELNIPLFIFLYSLCLSVIFAIDFKTALITLLKKNMEWLLLFFIVIATINTKKRLKIFFGILLFSALSLIFDSIFQLITGADLFLGRPLIHGRLTASFKHYNDFAGYLGVLFLISLTFYIFKKGSYKLFFAFISLLLGYCLIMTMSRVGLLSALIAVAVLVIASLFKLQFKETKVIIFNFIIILFILILVLFLGNKMQLKLFTYRWVDKSQFDFDWQYRLHLWQISLSLFKARPFFGYGLGSFMSVFRKADPMTSFTYAHNCYLQFLVEAGILGLLSLLSTILIFFKICVSSLLKNNNFLLLGILSGILAYLIHAGFDTHFYSMQLSDFFWIMLGLAIAIKRNGPIEI